MSAAAVAAMALVAAAGPVAGSVPCGPGGTDGPVWTVTAGAVGSVSGVVGAGSVAGVVTAGSVGGVVTGGSVGGVVGCGSVCGVVTGGSVAGVVTGGSVGGVVVGGSVGGVVTGGSVGGVVLGTHPSGRVAVNVTGRCVTPFAHWATNVSDHESVVSGPDANVTLSPGAAAVLVTSPAVTVIGPADQPAPSTG